jgi:hypothetical protein
MNFRPLFLLATLEAAALASLSVFFSEHLETGLYVIGVSLLSWLNGWADAKRAAIADHETRDFEEV